MDHAHDRQAGVQKALENFEVRDVVQINEARCEALHHGTDEPSLIRAGQSEAVRKYLPPLALIAACTFAIQKSQLIAAAAQLGGRKTNVGFCSSKLAEFLMNE